MAKTAIIIPCYNEELRFDETKIKSLLNHKNCAVFFANDGSKDKTVEIIQKIVDENPNCFLFDFKINEGKANTVYKAINQIRDLDEYDFIGYFDADFSTPPEEVLRLISEIENSTFDFVFGSRVLLLNSGIKRKSHRHIIGRIILTLVNLKFKLGIYDTQCGAKIFSKNIISECFYQPFYTNWLFDVEVFVRLQKKNLLKNGKEIPIFNWRDVDGSKLNWKSGFGIIRELAQLYKYY